MPQRTRLGGWTRVHVERNGIRRLSILSTEVLTWVYPICSKRGPRLILGIFAAIRCAVGDTEMPGMPGGQSVPTRVLNMKQH